MLLTIPATLCVLLLVAHSLYFRPLRATLLIFAFAIPASAMYGGEDFYIFNVASPRFYIADYPIPIINMVGFIFTFYCSLTLSIHLFEDRQGRRTAPFFLLLCSTVYVSAFVGWAIEYTNLAAEWWYWTAEFEFFNITGIVRLFGVWSWRSLLIFPILLQFFVRRSTGIGRVKVYCVLWFAFFFAWMVVVDLVAFLPPIVPLLWVALPVLAIKIKQPEVALDYLQFNRPVPLRARWKTVEEGQQ